MKSCYSLFIEVNAVPQYRLVPRHVSPYRCVQTCSGNSTGYWLISHLPAELSKRLPAVYRNRTRLNS